MKPVLLTDFGSTYTKLTAIDLDAARILGTAQSYTTVAEDVRIGFQKALDALLAQTGPLTFAQSFACSSAAGGLRMMVSGLVPELTMEAARLASLGAGAKIVGQFSFELTQDDLETIQRVNPDIFLLVGGTDGGNSACVIHNAQMLATIRPQFPIVLAGNRTAMQQCRKALEGCEVSVCENVMPKFGVLKTEDTQKTIRSIFLRRIVQAKGLSAAAEQMSGPMMPTPAAVMQAMTLLAKGTDKTPGIGELIGVDVGGATTDVYSIAEGMPRQMNRVYKGLPEPYAKRTVEGDIGMRYSIEGVLTAAGGTFRAFAGAGGDARAAARAQYADAAGARHGTGTARLRSCLHGRADCRDAPRRYARRNVYDARTDLRAERKGSERGAQGRRDGREPHPFAAGAADCALCLL